MGAWSSKARGETGVRDDVSRDSGVLVPRHAGYAWRSRWPARFCAAACLSPHHSHSCIRTVPAAGFTTGQSYRSAFWGVNQKANLPLLLSPRPNGRKAGETTCHTGTGRAGSAQGGGGGGATVPLPLASDLMEKTRTPMASIPPPYSAAARIVRGRSSCRNSNRFTADRGMSSCSPVQMVRRCSDRLSVALMATRYAVSRTVTIRPSNCCTFSPITGATRRDPSSVR